MSSIEATITASQLRWTGHIIRMNDSRLPKAVCNPGGYDTYSHQRALRYNVTPSWSSWTTAEAQFALGQRPVNTRIGTQ